MEILHILSFWLGKTLFRQSQQRPAGATTVLGNQAGQKSTTNIQKYKLPLELQPTKLGQDPCAKCKHGDCLPK